MFWDVMMWWSDIWPVLPRFGPAWGLIIKAVGSFILLVIIRITVPRLKLESLSRLGWVMGLGMLFLTFLTYMIFWFVA